MERTKKEREGSERKTEKKKGKVEIFEGKKKRKEREGRKKMGENKKIKEESE